MGDALQDKVLIFDAERCTGCCICELICSMDKQGEYNPQKSWIRVLKNWEMDVNIVAVDLRCDGCNKCVDWCPSKAIRFISAEQAALIRKNNPVGMFPAPLIGGEPISG